MMNRGKASLWLCLCLFVAFAVLALGWSASNLASKEAAAKAKPALLPAKEIIERHIIASGGFELLSSMSSMHIVWKKSDQGRNWKYERWRVRGQDFATRSLDGEVKHTLGCWVADPDVETDSLLGVMWTKTGDRVYLQGGDRLKKRLAEASIIDDRTRWFETNRKIVCKSVEQVDGRDCYMLEFKGIDGELVQRFFDAETFLLLRTNRYERDVSTGLQSQKYADHKNVGGVVVPMTQTVITEDRMDVWRVEQVEFDTEFDIDQFPVPGAALAAIDDVLRKLRFAPK